MNQFKKYIHRKTLTENESSKGIFIGAKLTSESIKKITEFCNSLGISTLEEEQEYHITIIYSKNYFEFDGFETLNNLVKSLRPPLKFLEYKMFGPDKNCLVLTVEDMLLKNLQKIILDSTEATHTFKNYIPHVTLNYEFDSYVLPTKLPNFSIEIDSLYMEELDEDYA